MLGEVECGRKTHEAFGSIPSGRNMAHGSRLRRYGDRGGEGDMPRRKASHLSILCKLRVSSSVRDASLRGKASMNDGS